MFLNDAFDASYDRGVRPERPIPSGEIGVRRVFAIGFGLLLAGEALLALPSVLAGRVPDLETMAWGVVLAAGIVYYDFRHKRDPASPVVMALCRAAVYFIAAAAVSTALDGRVAAGAGIMASYLVGLTYVAKQENLSEVRNLWPLAFLAAPAIVAPRLASASDPARLLYLVFWTWCIYAVWHLVRQPRDIPRAVVSLIAGIALVDGVLMASAGATALGWVAFGGFLLTLVLQRYVPAT
jgi:4-hydroxybenzoate polyprenyltransferase